MKPNQIKALRIVSIALIVSLMVIVTFFKYETGEEKNIGVFLRHLFFDELATEYLGALISVLVLYGFLFALGKSLTDMINQDRPSELAEMAIQIAQLKDSVKSDLTILTSKIDNIAHEIKVIQPQKIEDILEEGRKDTDFWFFNGGTGTYTKAVTLPKLSDRASKLAKTIAIDLLIINPFNEEICAHYAQLRSSLRRDDRDSSKWTSGYVRNHSLATILLCYALCSKNKFLNISIGLKNHFSLFRFDISSKNVLITKEDPKELAMLFEKSSFTYDSYKSDFQQTFAQSTRVVQLKNLKMRTSLIELDRNSAKQIMNELALAPDISDGEYDQIVELCKNYSSPYVRSAN